MGQITLQSYHNRLDCLLTEGTLSELLEFLGMQYFEGSRQEGNENRDVYEFVDKGIMATEVLLKESRVCFWSNFSSWMSPPNNDNFWSLLFDGYPKLVKRLMELLDKKYSYLGSLSYELRLGGKFNEFKKEYLELNNSKS